MPSFQCLQCGDCCFGRGGVSLTPAGAAVAAAFLGLTPAEFQKFMAPGRAGEILTGPDGFCLFHQPDGRCRIHPVKPDICRRWPYLPALLNIKSAFDEARGACPGLAAAYPGPAWADFKAAASREWLAQND
ncbi:MAG: YkgJ family cysteine cluster protein [Candidatus Adiutrix sp.]|nr:YkgJ family cysteine cluster protein [Candidatus Adiutrix sp.]